jgi:hypothetical protein
MLILFKKELTILFRSKKRIKKIIDINPEEENKEKSKKL